jgi:hypothetical protein
MGDQIKNVVAPAAITIPGGIEHAMTPVSNFVVLLYHFPSPKKKFDAIVYSFKDRYIPVPRRPSKSMYSCPVSKEEANLVRTSKL